MPEVDRLRATLRALMRSGATHTISDADFNALALQVFAHQFALNQPFRRYCERRDRRPSNVQHWTGIPALPTAAFKEVALVAGDPAAATLVFRTSGTTRGRERRGTHYLLDPALYDLSLGATFHHFVLREKPRMRMLSLVPPSTELPDSSLSYMVTALIREYGTDGSGFFTTSQGGIDREPLAGALREAVAKGEPVCLLGTSLAFVRWLDGFELQLQLPAGSRLMDTGGFKGEQREIAPHELRQRYSERLGLSESVCVNEYGMTELCSQYYDAALVNIDGNRAGLKRGPPWVRARVVDADTLAPVPQGTTGILQHFDLANLDSVSAILTEDLAVELGDGFVLLGRAPGAPPRGCSIAMDILLSDAER